MLKSIANHSLLKTGGRSILKNASVNITSRSFCRATSPKMDVQDGPTDHGYTDHDKRFENNLPTIEYAKVMPNRFSAMRHEQILQLCVEGSYSGE